MIAVMLGGALGAGFRYGLSQLMNPTIGTGMPWGTLTVNVLGCLLIGWLSASLNDASEAIRLGVLAGVLGGFTTFSSFGLETIRLLETGESTTAALYLLISNLAGLGAVFLGLKFSS